MSEAVLSAFICDASATQMWEHAGFLRRSNAVRVEHKGFAPRRLSASSAESVRMERRVLFTEDDKVD